jgi:hypothetical protein
VRRPSSQYQLPSSGSRAVAPEGAPAGAGNGKRAGPEAAGPEAASTEPVGTGRAS